MSFSADTDCFKREKGLVKRTSRKRKVEKKKEKGEMEKGRGKRKNGGSGLVYKGGYRKQTMNIKIVYNSSFEFC